MYDVALSFAGEDRHLASRIADLCKSIGLSVFYDEYERAALWGKDLAAHLDTTYRKDTVVCVVLISEAYRRKLWTRHEIRSIFAAMLETGDDFLLPVRVDDTDLPGLSPTVGFVDARVTPADEIVWLLAEKLGVGLDSTFRATENLEKLREWGIPSSIFVVDSRFVEEDGIEARLAVSFGPNVSGSFGQILMPRPVDGPYLLGMHTVGTEPRNKILRMHDMWYNGRAYTAELSQLAAMRAAQLWLDELSDADYAFHAGDTNTHDASRVRRSPPVSLGSYCLKGDTEP
jgi:hypothetical protein